MSRSAQIERLRGLALAILDELEVLSPETEAPKPQKPAAPSAAALERVAKLRARRERRKHG